MSEILPARNSNWGFGWLVYDSYSVGSASERINSRGDSAELNSPPPPRGGSGPLPLTLHYPLSQALRVISYH